MQTGNSLTIPKLPIPNLTGKGDLNMASLTFNHCSYYAVFSVSGNKKIWKGIDKVTRVETKQILKQLEREYELKISHYRENESTK
jgi:hypothetical protein